MSKSYKVKKPKWYSPYKKPEKPTIPSEPLKTHHQLIKNQTIFHEMTYEGRHEIDLDQFIKESKNKKMFLVLVHDHMYEDDYRCECEYSASIQTQEYEEIPNSTYVRDLKIYKKAFSKYKEDLALWKERCKKWKIIKANEARENNEKEKDARKKQYEKLKKEFEG